MILELRIYSDDDNPVWDFDQQDLEEFRSLMKKLNFYKKRNYYPEDEPNSPWYKLGYSGFSIRSYRELILVCGRNVYWQDRSGDSGNTSVAYDDNKVLENWLKIYVELRQPEVVNLIG